jgi:hypothetical protein
MPLVTYIFELESGETPSLLCFVQGEPQAVQTLGNAFIHFDGETVFLCSADAREPALVEDRPISRRWTPVVPPCRIRAGNVRATMRCSTARALRDPAVEARSDFDHGDVTRCGDEDDVTRCFDSPVTEGQPGSESPHVETSAAVRETAGPTTQAPTVVTSSAKAVAKRHTGRYVAMAFLTTSCIALLWFAAWQRRPKPSMVRAEATTPAVEATVNDPPPVASDIVVYPAPSTPPASGPASSSSPDKRGPKGGGGHSDSAPTLERMAADAVYRGDLDTAAQLYKELAELQRDNPAFSSAQRTLGGGNGL